MFRVEQAKGLAFKSAARRLSAEPVRRPEDHDKQAAAGAHQAIAEAGVQPNLSEFNVIGGSKQGPRPDLKDIWAAQLGAVEPGYVSLYVLALEYVLIILYELRYARSIRC